MRRARPPPAGKASQAVRAVALRLSRTPEINRYLYENLVSNVECQIEHWNRKAARREQQQQSDPDTAQTLRAKAEGLGYALRLLDAFEPEFCELTDAAIRSTTDGQPCHDP